MITLVVYIISLILLIYICIPTLIQKILKNLFPISILKFKLYSFNCIKGIIIKIVVKSMYGIQSFILSIPILTVGVNFKQLRLNINIIRMEIYQLKTHPVAINRFKIIQGNIDSSLITNFFNYIIRKTRFQNVSIHQVYKQYQNYIHQFKKQQQKQVRQTQQKQMKKRSQLYRLIFGALHFFLMMILQFIELKLTSATLNIVSHIPQCKQQNSQNLYSLNFSSAKNHKRSLLLLRNLCELTLKIQQLLIKTQIINHSHEEIQIYCPKLDLINWNHPEESIITGQQVFLGIKIPFTLEIKQSFKSINYFMKVQKILFNTEPKDFETIMQIIQSFSFSLVKIIKLCEFPQRVQRKQKTDQVQTSSFSLEINKINLILTNLYQQQHDSKQSIQYLSNIKRVNLCLSTIQFNKKQFHIQQSSLKLIKQNKFKIDKDFFVQNKRNQQFIKSRRQYYDEDMIFITNIIFFIQNHKIKVYHDHTNLYCAREELALLGKLFRLINDRMKFDQLQPTHYIQLFNRYINFSNKKQTQFSRSNKFTNKKQTQLIILNQTSPKLNKQSNRLNMVQFLLDYCFVKSVQITNRSSNSSIDEQKQPLRQNTKLKSYTSSKQFIYQPSSLTFILLIQNLRHQLSITNCSYNQIKKSQQIQHILCIPSLNLNYNNRKQFYIKDLKMIFRQIPTFNSFALFIQNVQMSQNQQTLIQYLNGWTILKKLLQIDIQNVDQNQQTSSYHTQSNTKPSKKTITIRKIQLQYQKQQILIKKIQLDKSTLSNGKINKLYFSLDKFDINSKLMKKQGFNLKKVPQKEKYEHKQKLNTQKNVFSQKKQYRQQFRKNINQLQKQGEKRKKVSRKLIKPQQKGIQVIFTLFSLQSLTINTSLQSSQKSSLQISKPVTLIHIKNPLLTFPYFPISQKIIHYLKSYQLLEPHFSLYLQNATEDQLQKYRKNNQNFVQSLDCVLIKVTNFKVKIEQEPMNVHLENYNRFIRQYINNPSINNANKAQSNNANNNANNPSISNANNSSSNNANKAQSNNKKRTNNILNDNSMSFNNKPANITNKQAFKRDITEVQLISYLTKNRRQTNLCQLTIKQISLQTSNLKNVFNHRRQSVNDWITNFKNNLEGKSNHTKNTQPNHQYRLRKANVGELKIAIRNLQFFVRDYPHSIVSLTYVHSKIECMRTSNIFNLKNYFFTGDVKIGPIKLNAGLGMLSGFIQIQKKFSSYLNSIVQFQRTKIFICQQNSSSAKRRQTNLKRQVNQQKSHLPWWHILFQSTQWKIKLQKQVTHINLLTGTTPYSRQSFCIQIGKFRCNSQRTLTTLVIQSFQLFFLQQKIITLKDITTKLSILYDDDLEFRIKLDVLTNHRGNVTISKDTLRNIANIKQLRNDWLIIYGFKVHINYHNQQMPQNKDKINYFQLLNYTANQIIDQGQNKQLNIFSVLKAIELKVRIPDFHLILTNQVQGIQFSSQNFKFNHQVRVVKNIKRQWNTIRSDLQVQKIWGSLQIKQVKVQQDERFSFFMHKNSQNIFLLTKSLRLNFNQYKIQKQKIPSEIVFISKHLSAESISLCVSLKIKKQIQKLVKSFSPQQLTREFIQRTRPLLSQIKKDPIQRFRQIVFKVIRINKIRKRNIFGIKSFNLLLEVANIQIILNSQKHSIILNSQSNIKFQLANIYRQNDHNYQYPITQIYFLMTDVKIQLLNQLKTFFNQQNQLNQDKSKRLNFSYSQKLQLLMGIEQNKQNYNNFSVGKCVLQNGSIQMTSQMKSILTQIIEFIILLTNNRDKKKADFKKTRQKQTQLLTMGQSNLKQKIQWSYSDLMTNTSQKLLFKWNFQLKNIAIRLIMPVQQKIQFSVQSISFIKLIKPFLKIESSLISAQLSFFSNERIERLIQVNDLTIYNLLQSEHSLFRKTLTMNHQQSLALRVFINSYDVYPISSISWQYIKQVSAHINPIKIRVTQLLYNKFYQFLFPQSIYNPNLTQKCIVEVNSPQLQCLLPQYIYQLKIQEIKVQIWFQTQSILKRMDGIGIRLGRFQINRIFQHKKVYFDRWVKFLLKQVAGQIFNVIGQKVFGNNQNQ